LIFRYVFNEKSVKILAERPCGANYTLSPTLNTLLDESFENIYYNIIFLKARRRRRVFFGGGIFEEL